MLAETKADADRRRAAAQREVEDLTRQKDSIASHLAQVRQLLGGSLPGMDAAAQALAPKPAIAAEPAAPAPSTPASGPRNGNATPPAPTTVQPVPSSQAAAHQPTQVSPAPTVAQQRPANGGTPAAAQASAKQSANGKDDDEDWWTE
jgi:hypothetical protein